jgi:multidrug efflux pump subunit AcrA (membrane-fusion protein)
MHPTVVSDRPGDCPICSMKMVPMEEEGAGAASREGPGAPASPRRKIIYRSTMRPSEISDKPGKDSMGMEMVAEEIDTPPPGAVTSVGGRAAVTITEQKRQLIGVKTATVERKHLVRTIRTVGRVTYDETRLHHVHTKIGGYVERLHANATGQVVKAGEPLLTIYSPELLASGQEYILALKARDRLAGSSLPSIRDSGQDLVESARRRLLLYDLTPDQIEALGKTGEAPRSMTLHAPISGHIVARNVTQGEKIEPGTTLLDIADLSRVWVLADVYEYELPFVHEGQSATITLSYMPGRSFEGRIALVYPVLAETTRTVKARIELANPDLELKPEMYAEVEIRSDLGERLIVPETAVLSTGERDIVFVDRGEGYFEPRELRIGARLPDGFEVLQGLTEGETVVSGNFFVDAESKMKADLSAAAPPTKNAPAAPPPGNRD